VSKDKERKKKEVSKEHNVDTGLSLKQRQGEHTITLRKPDGIFHVQARDCWHEGTWLLFRVEKSDGFKLVHKVPPWRIVAVMWTEGVDERG